MGSVTIAATYGAGGSIIGPAVTKRLGLHFVDRAIPASMAEKIHEPLMAALASDEDEPSAAGRLLYSTLGYTGLLSAAELRSGAIAAGGTELAALPAATRAAMDDSRRRRG